MNTFVRTIFKPLTVKNKKTKFAYLENVTNGKLYTLTFQSTLGGAISFAGKNPYISIKEGNNTLHEFEYQELGGGIRILQTINIVSNGEPLTVLFDFVKSEEGDGFIVSEAITDLLGHDVDIETITVE